MKRIWFLCVFAAFALLAAGCDHSRAIPPAPSGTAVPASKGQPKLPTIKLWLGAQELVVEQALTPSQIQSGMMFRQELGEMEGMLFVFAAPHAASFWMKNTLVPLSCAFIDRQGIILEIRDMKPLDETPVASASDQVQYVLEVNQGWFERHEVRPGMLVRTEHGSLQETYFRNQRP